jgi:WD40 repeat protein
LSNRDFDAENNTLQMISDLEREIDNLSSHSSSKVQHQVNQQADTSVQSIRMMKFSDSLAIDNSKSSSVYNRKIQVRSLQKSLIGDKCDSKSTSYDLNVSFMIVFDGNVLIFHINSQSGRVFTSVDLSRPATCAEFISDRFLAIGCSDVDIRVWDLQANKVVKVFESHSKGDIILLKNLASSRYVYCKLMLTIIIIIIFC